MVKDLHPQAVKEATAQVLPVWLEAFKVLLNLDAAQDVASTNWDGLAIRMEIFKVRLLTTLAILLCLTCEDSRSFAFIVSSSIVGIHT
jgi:hypothetical protein